MPIYFRSGPVNEPYTFNSVGNHWNQEDIMRPRGFSLYHYLQTEKGCGRLTILGKTYLQNDGQGVLIAPFIRHSYFAETTQWLTSFATFTGTAESSIAKILGNRQIIFTDREQGERIGSLICDVAARFEHPPADAMALSIDCYGLLMNFVDGVYTRDMLEDPLYQRYVAPVVKEIETHYDTGLTVQELSRLVYVTPQYLSRLFGRFLGCSAYEYLTSYRINKAKELLMIHPRMEVQEISLRTGYQDTSHFIAMFKKVTGTTPLEFRKLN